MNRKKQIKKLDRENNDLNDELIEQDLKLKTIEAIIRKYGYTSNYTIEEWLYSYLETNEVNRQRTKELLEELGYCGTPSVDDVGCWLKSLLYKIDQYRDTVKKNLEVIYDTYKTLREDGGYHGPDLKDWVTRQAFLVKEFGEVIKILRKQGFMGYSCAALRDFFMERAE